MSQSNLSMDIVEFLAKLFQNQSIKKLNTKSSHFITFMPLAFQVVDLFPTSKLASWRKVCKGGKKGHEH